MKKYLVAKVLCVMMAAVIFVSVPVAPAYGLEPGDCPSPTVIRPRNDELPPDGCED